MREIWMISLVLVAVCAVSDAAAQTTVDITGSWSRTTGSAATHVFVPTVLVVENAYINGTAGIGAFECSDTGGSVRWLGTSYPCTHAHDHGDAMHVVGGDAPYGTFVEVLVHIS